MYIIFEVYDILFKHILNACFLLQFVQKGHTGWRAVSSVGTASRVRHVSLTMVHVPGAAWRDLRDPCV